MALIHFLLDRSGSMETCLNDTIGGFNAFVREQAPKSTMSLYLFNNSFEIVYENRSIEDVEKLSASTFRPRGGTALLDAIARTIEQVEKNNTKRWADIDEVGNVIVILTDGDDNSSTKCTKREINDAISRKQAQGWKFVFLAANQDAIKSANDIGIGRDAAIDFDTANVCEVMRSASSALSRCVTGESQDIVFTQEERLKELFPGYLR
jgi:Mg-chelatase subunit ChlD